MMFVVRGSIDGDVPNVIMSLLFPDKAHVGDVPMTPTF